MWRRLVPEFVAQEIWQDLEMSDVAQEQTLQDITQKAMGVWNGAVEHAEQHRHGIRQRIDNAAAEMKTIAEQLGELTALEDPSISMVPFPWAHFGLVLLVRMCVLLFCCGPVGC